MNAFTAAAVALLSRYSNNLLKEDSVAALSGKVLGDNERKSENIVQTIISFIDSFGNDDYLVRGLYRITGSLAAQQNALNIIENAQGAPLKLYFICELNAEDRASCIKKLLRKMPDTLFPFCTRAALLDLAGVAKKAVAFGRDQQDVFKALQILVYFIPESHKQCLESLLDHLNAVAAHSEVNKMDVSNLGLLFSPYIFPISKDHESVEQAKQEIDDFGHLFPILLAHSDQLFHMSEELFRTLDASLMKQATEQKGDSLLNSFNSTYSPLLQTPQSLCSGRNDEDDPEVVMVQTCSKRVLTPTRSTTELEMAKLAANIASMSEGPTRNRLLKKMMVEQRRKLGIRKGSLLKRAFTPT